MPEERTPAESGPEKPGPLRGAAFLLRRWFLPGLVVSTVLAVLAIGIQLSSIEGDLEDRVAARMEQAGLVVRKPSETDGRIVNVYITDAGKKAYEKILPLAMKHYRQAIEGVRVREQKDLINSLHQVLENIRRSPFP